MFRTLSNFFYRVACLENAPAGIGAFPAFPLFLFKASWREIDRLAEKPLGSIDTLWFGFQPDTILRMIHANGPA